MGLKECSHRLVRDLSGGERKRLSIALEIIDDPSILFIDEPTTGLDSIAALQCLNLLKKLTSHGRAVVCSMHVPSTTMLNLFDFIFIISRGECVYQGSPSNMMSFLEATNNQCPENSTPVEYILDLSNDSVIRSVLISRLKNERNDIFRQLQTEQITENNGKRTEMKVSSSMLLDCNYSTQTMPACNTQIDQILRRMALTYSRNPNILLLRFSIHIIIAIFIGIMYSNVENDSHYFLNTSKFLFFNIFILMFTAFSSVQTNCKFIYCS